MHITQTTHIMEHPMGKFLGIFPSKYFENIQLGMSLSEVHKFLSDPDVIKISRLNPTFDHSETWIFGDLGLKLSFIYENGSKLNKIAIDSEDYLFYEKIQIGQSIEEVKSSLEEIKLGKIKHEDWKEVGLPGHALVRIEGSHLNLWFDDNKLSEFQWHPIINEEEEAVYPYVQSLNSNDMDLNLKNHNTDKVFSLLNLQSDILLQKLFEDRAKNADQIAKLPPNTKLESLLATNNSVAYFRNKKGKTPGSIMAKAKLLHSTKGEIGWIALELSSDLNVIEVRLETK